MSRLSVVVACIAILAARMGVAWAQQKQPQWKDQAEYALYESITKEKDNKKKIELLNSWKEKYPATDFKAQRQLMFMTTYAEMNQPEKVLEAGDELLSEDPKNLQALALMVVNTQRLTNPSASWLASGEKAAKSLLANLDELFAADRKPANMSADAWKKARTDLEVLAHTTLGWVAMQRKDNEAAEKEFDKTLEINPNNAQVSYWLGTVILNQKKPERQSEVLFHFARAASLEGQGALNPQGRAEVDKYLTKAYNTYHGPDPKGLEELKRLAKSQPMPPAGFKIENINEISARKEEELKQKNPQLALWLGIKKALTAPDGEQYFEQNMKGHLVPKLKGKLISEKPTLRPKELVLGISDPNTPEVILKLDAPLPGKGEVGSDIQFDGVPASFSKEPFMVTFDVEKASISGWTGKSEAPARKTVRRPKKK